MRKHSVKQNSTYGNCLLPNSANTDDSTIYHYTLVLSEIEVYYIITKLMCLFTKAKTFVQPDTRSDSFGLLLIHLLFLYI